MIPEGKLFIDGKWVEPESRETYNLVNPANAEVHARVAKANEADVDKAVKAARSALEGPWARLSPAERGKTLLKMAELIAKNAETLANMDSEDMGKPITQARGEQAGSTPLFDYYAGLADKIEGTVHPVGDDFFNYTMLEPIGVVAGIAPWNFPTWMFCMKVAPPLACGCTMVFKPAGISPRSSLLMGSLSKEAGIPDGVVNVVTGEGSKMGNALVGHAGVNHVSLTGSSPVGKRVAETSARHLAGAILELGGKTPNIIFADAPWEEAVNGSMVGAFINCGQVCVSASRLLVEEKIKDDFVAEMVKRAKKLKLGDPKKEDTTLGPICSKGQYETVTSYIEVGKKEGAKVLIGGGTPSEPSLSKGFYVLPTIFDGVKNEMKIAQEEIFGPVVSVVTFKDEEDAIAKANDICYGLEACIWTKDLRRAHRMARRIEAGIICVNCWGLTHAAVPYAGFKDSGMGVESGLSAIESYTRKKNVWVRMSEVTAQWP